MITSVIHGRDNLHNRWAEGDDTMIELQLIYGVVMVVVTVTFHVICLVLIGKLIRALMPVGVIRPSALHAVQFLSLTVFLLMICHIIEAVAWAMVYIHIGEFEEFTRALYFSVVTSTALGYGDITLSASWQILGAFEAVGGLLLYGASTAVLFQSMLKLLPDPFDTDSPESDLGRNG